MTSPERSLGSNQVVLGGHDVAGVGNIHELLHRYGIEGESHLYLSAIDTALELAQATDASDEVDALVLAQVAEVEVDSTVQASILYIREQLKHVADKTGETAFSIYVSDRRWKKAVNLLRASAFVHGHKQTNPTDIAVLAYCHLDTLALEFHSL